MQLLDLREYAQRRGWEIHDEYVDTGWSGGRASRPHLDRLMADARRRKVDAVLVWKLDRWGRSLVDCLTSIQELVGLGIRWIAITQNLDTDESNPMSRFMLHVMGAFSEFERETIRERVKSGLKAAAAKGRCGGRPRRVCDRAGIIELRRLGAAYGEIARRMGVPETTVRRIWLESQRKEGVLG
jgi:DNA invertase Pin-like site-specific DNA recombinase